MRVSNPAPEVIRCDGSGFFQASGYLESFSPVRISRESKWMMHLMKNGSRDTFHHTFLSHPFQIRSDCRHSFSLFHAYRPLTQPTTRPRLQLWMIISEGKWSGLSVPLGRILEFP
ncbi:hypothetical protein AVEN_171367-1 [Araneus ventricosus]|uniref:Uncharacterized protein n=1 Tax=Araneus ventricosus TaxID=182803 RepID=A0A4Y2JV10_ARAVE|nr:hypothetical protein AVEN_171367-1 [Araneus ventricosus]